MDALTALRSDVRALRTQVADLAAQAESVQREIARSLASEHLRLADRASLAALPSARLKSGLIVLEGHPAHRMRARRVRVGAPLELPYAPSIGVRRCLTDAADVRERWAALLAAEAASGHVLRSDAATVLDVPDAVAALAADRRLRISMTAQATGARRTLAVPQFTYAFPPRKLRNFAHWLLDCAPQIAAMLAVAPDATFLMPEPILPLHRATFALLGVGDDRLMAWTGAGIGGDRVVAFESDGRFGGGRPLSALMELRRQLAPAAGGRPHRRLYVSRRDAKPKRRWAANEPEVESVFRRCGFDIIVSSDSTLPELAGLFREAEVVAGVNGAGFAHILFAPPGAHLIALFTDSLIRWHADDEGARSLWSRRVDPEAAPASFGDSPHFFGPVAAAFGQKSHALVVPDTIPADGLGAFLDAALEDMGTS